jgi:hypothetical protein
MILFARCSSGPGACRRKRSAGRQGRDSGQNLAWVKAIEDQVTMMSGRLVTSGSMCNDHDSEVGVSGTGDVVGSVPHND